MLTILEKYRGGPVGVGTIAASDFQKRRHHRGSLRAYLIQLGFLNRTPRRPRRKQLAFRLFNVKTQAAARRQPGCFEPAPA